MSEFDYQSDVERDTYRLEQGYQSLTFSKLRPILDFELNELQSIISGFNKIITTSSLSDGPVGDAFLVEASPSDNTIIIRSGFFIVEGVVFYNPEDIVKSDLQTPTANRTEYIYLEWDYSEVTGQTDPLIYDENVGRPTATRTKLNYVIKTSNGNVIPTPAAGKRQFRLATITRPADEAVITSSMILDDRTRSGQCYVSLGGKVKKTGTLTVSVEATSGLVGANRFSISSQTIVVPNNAPRYLYIAEDPEELVISASLPTTYHVPLAYVRPGLNEDTNTVEILELRDLRRFSPLAGRGGEGSSSSVININAGASIAKFQLVYASSTDNTALLARANSETTMPVLGIAMDDANISQDFRVLTAGIITNDAWNLTPGGLVYADPNVAGNITQILPSTLSHLIQRIGIALDVDTIYISPDLLYQVVGGASLHTQNTDVGSTSSSFTLRYGNAANISSPAGFFVNRGSINPEVGVRYNPGGFWELTNDGVNWNRMAVLGEYFREDYVATPGQTLITLPTGKTYVPGTGDLLVFSGGTLANPGVGNDYLETSPNSITFNASLLEGQSVSLVKGLGALNVVKQYGYYSSTIVSTTNSVDLLVTPTLNSIMLFVDGELKIRNTHYSSAGTVINFTPALNPGQTLVINYVY